MRPPHSDADATASFASPPVAGAGAGPTDGTVAMPSVRSFFWARRSLPIPTGPRRPDPGSDRDRGADRRDARDRRRRGLGADGARASQPRRVPGLGCGSAAVADHASVHRRATPSVSAFSAVLVAMIVAYGVALAAVRSLSMRLIAVAVVRPARDPADEPAAAAQRRLELPRLRPARRAAPLQPVHARDQAGVLRSRVRVLDLAQPAQPVRVAVHGAHLPARVRLAAGRLLDLEGRDGAAEPLLHRARLAVRAPARARPAVRGRVRGASTRSI